VQVWTPEGVQLSRIRKRNPRDARGPQRTHQNPTGNVVLRGNPLGPCRFLLMIKQFQISNIFDICELTSRPSCCRSNMTFPSASDSFQRRRCRRSPSLPIPGSRVLVVIGRSDSRVPGH
jgi:hypothetical protein